MTSLPPVLKLPTPPARPTVFKDAAGREWDCAITVGTIKDVKALLGVDLTKVYEQGSDIAARLMTDVVFLCDVLFAVLKKQADAALPPVTDQAFAEALSGDVLADAADALMQGLLDFPRHPEIRAALRKVYEAQKKAEDKTAAELNRQIGSPEFQGAIDRATNQVGLKMAEGLRRLQEQSGEPSGSAPESLASIHAPSRLAS